jgi:hypothetical protein
MKIPSHGLLHIPKVFPPNGSLSIQVKHGYSNLQFFTVVMDSEVFI